MIDNNVANKEVTESEIPIDAFMTENRHRNGFINDFFDHISAKIELVNSGSIENNSSEARLAKEAYQIDFSKIKLITPKKTKSNFFEKTQKWIGHIVEINSNGFVAKLEDLSAHGTNEIGEFEMDDVSEEDKILVKLGSAFYWSVGYSNENGQVSKKSFVRFQRILNWDEPYFDRVMDRAESLSKKLKWE